MKRGSNLCKQAHRGDDGKNLARKATLRDALQKKSSEELHKGEFATSTDGMAACSGGHSTSMNLRHTMAADLNLATNATVQDELVLKGTVRTSAACTL